MDPKSSVTAFCIRRDPDPDTETPWGETQGECAWGELRRVASGETDARHILISDLQPPEQWEKKCLWFQLSSVWDFVVVPGQIHTRLLRHTVWGAGTRPGKGKEGSETEGLLWSDSLGGVFQIRETDSEGWGVKGNCKPGWREKEQTGRIVLSLPGFHTSFFHSPACLSLPKVLACLSGIYTIYSGTLKSRTVPHLPSQ